MAIDRDVAIGVLDLARGEIKRIDIGDASRAVNNAVGLGRVLGALVGEDDAQPAVRLFNSLDADGCPEPDSNPLALGVQVRDRIASMAGNSCGSASRIVTSEPARA
jgi:hypothetical protein